jgi:hypothetical protein
VVTRLSEHQLEALQPVDPADWPSGTPGRPAG